MGSAAESREPAAASGFCGAGDDEGADALTSLLRQASEGGADFWRALCPWLHVEDPEFCEGARSCVWPYAEGDPDLADRADAWGTDLINEGYFVAQPEDLGLPWAVDVAGLARGVEALRAAGLPPSCILAYDEPWLMAAQLRQLVRVVSGGNEPIMDWAAFHVRASASAAAAVGAEGAAAPAGWPPHRDRGSDESLERGFRADGSPCYTTFWLALTDATPASSCLMVVPRSRDPGYRDGDRGRSPLTTIFSTPEAFQHIRALPTRAGGLVAFSHRLLHWGSAADPRAAGPRVSIAFAAADPAFDEPYFPRALLPFPALALRLALVAGLALAYCANEALLTTRARAEVFWQLFRAQAGVFGSSFQQVVAKHKAFLDETLPRSGAGAAVAAEETAQEEEEAAGDMEGLFQNI